jgi:hypothetical protein
LPVHQSFLGYFNKKISDIKNKNYLKNEIFLLFKLFYRILKMETAKLSKKTYKCSAIDTNNNIIHIYNNVCVSMNDAIYSYVVFIDSFEKYKKTSYLRIINKDNNKSAKVHLYTEKINTKPSLHFRDLIKDIDYN